ncbi:MAG TPA: hypothetical protein VN329_07460 [Roseomonas sp.]|nr:hypothetical protein [Roseomonas sp.]
MIRHSLPVLLAMLATAPPALAQHEPFRVVNGARVPATALHIVRSGRDGWGANLLRGPLAPGATLSMRPPEGTNCRFDLRLVFQDGQEAIRRDADVCQERQLVLGVGASAPAPVVPPLPQVGGGDQMLPSIGRRD